MPERIFKTQTEAVDFLRAQGYKLGRTKFHVDFHAGRIPCTSDKQFREKDLLIYGESLSAPLPHQNKKEVQYLIRLRRQMEVFSELTQNILLTLRELKEPTQHFLEEKLKQDLPLSENVVSNMVYLSKLDDKIIRDDLNRIKNTFSFQDENIFLGIALGIVANGRISPQSMIFLTQWLDEHTEISHLPIIKEIHQAVRSRVIESEFSKRKSIPIYNMLCLFIENAGLSIPDIKYEPPQHLENKKKQPVHVLLPKNLEIFDHPQEIDFTAAFCFTGVFAFGERRDCEAVIIRLGGRPKQYPVKNELCYLVIGTLSNPQWMLPQAGTKIENAKLNREQGCPTVIIHEDTWAEALVNQTNLCKE